MTRKNRSQSLQYPTNIASGNNDYFYVGIYSYEPPGIGQGGERIFQIPGSSSEANGTFLGQIILPMPDNVSDTNSVTWDTDTLNSIAAGSIGALSDAVESADLGSVLNDPLSAAKNVASSVSGSLTSAGNALKDSTVANALKTALVGQAVNIFGANVDLNSITSRTSGQVLNPNLELLFKGVILRQFNYSFTLTPRSREEGLAVKGIINTFKKRMAAKSSASNNAGAGLFIKAPDVFQLKFKQGDGDHPFLYKIKQCALTNMNVTYDSAGAYATYTDGTPVKMTLQLSFRELSPVYNEDYAEGLPSANEGVGF